MWSGKGKQWGTMWTFIRLDSMNGCLLSYWHGSQNVHDLGHNLCFLVADFLVLSPLTETLEKRDIDVTANERLLISNKHVMYIYYKRLLWMLCLQNLNSGLPNDSYAVTVLALGPPGAMSANCPTGPICWLPKVCKEPYMAGTLHGFSPHQIGLLIQVCVHVHVLYIIFTWM